MLGKVDEREEEDEQQQELNYIGVESTMEELKDQIMDRWAMEKNLPKMAR